MDFSCIIFGILFTVVGVLFASGKIHDRLPAWKNTPDEEKKKINILPLCRNVGSMIALCGVIFLFKGFSAHFTEKWFVIAMITWLVVAGLDVFLISKSKRYKKQ